MVVAKLVGNIWSTRKYESLNGYKLMLTEVIKGTEKGKSIVAVDTIGAGVGDRVIITQGSSARKLLEAESDHNIPVDAVIIGIIDDDCSL